MKVNSSAIYGSLANPFTEAPAWGRVTRGTNPQGGDRLYLMVFNWPVDGKLQLQGLLSGVGTVQILGQRTKQLFSHSQANGVTTFTLPTAPINPICTVVAVDLEGTLAIASKPVISAADEKFVGSLKVEVAASTSPELTYHYTVNGSEPTMQSAPATSPFTISATTTVKARGFYLGSAVTPIVSQTFELLTPLVAVQTLKSDAGLAYTSYAVPESIKNCGQIRAGNKEGQGVVAVPSVAVKPREEFFGLTFTGFIDVPEARWLSTTMNSTAQQRSLAPSRSRRECIPSNSTCSKARDKISCASRGSRQARRRKLSSLQQRGSTSSTATDTHTDLESLAR